MFRLASFGGLATLILIGISGCGPKPIPAGDIAKQSQTFEEAAVKLASKDYSGAKESAATALQGGALSADQAAEAILILIEAAIETGDLETAENNLAQAEISSNDMGRVYVLKGLLARKRGDESKAQEAFQQAQSHDPNVVIPG